MNGVVFLTTGKLQKDYKSWCLIMPFRGLTTDKLQINYRITSLLHHSYVRSDLWTIRTSAPSSCTCWKWFFRLCRQNASWLRNKLRPRSPFSGKKNIGNRTYPGWMAWISALCTCAHTHAWRENRTNVFLADFLIVCCLFYLFPVRNALRPFWRCVQLGCYGK